LTCYLCGKKHERRATLQIDYLNTPEAGGALKPENMVPACKPCAKRRNQRELPTYWIQRIQEIEAEKSHIKTMTKDVAALWDLAAMVRYAPRITPDAVEATDPKAPVLTRPTRIFDYYSLPAADRNAEAPMKGYPKNPQHGDIFIHATEERYVWDATWELKNGNLGNWIYLDKAAERGTFSADWASNPAHEVYPQADYAPSITPDTPHAVVGTGHKDDLEEDPVVMAAARVAPDADTEVTSVWFDGELYWRELCYTHPVTGEETLTDEVFTPD
jgi:hypothetical protein